VTAVVRLFIGSSGKNRLEEQVFIRSLRRHARGALQINIIDGTSGTVRMHDGDVRALPSGLAGGVGAVTNFSLARFAIPQWCGYEGRAIYCDSDQIVFADVAELWHAALGDAAVAAVPARHAHCAPEYRHEFLASVSGASADYHLSSVMLIDCARARAWDLRRVQELLNDGRLDYTELMFLGRDFRQWFDTRVAPLDPAWNALDVTPPGTRLLHFTDLTSQPWLFPHNRTSVAWEAEFFGALEEGALAPEHVAEARREAGVCLRIATVTRLPAAWRRPVNRVWRWIERLAPARLLLDGIAALETRVVPEHTWHWGGRPTAGRRLRRALGLVTRRLAAPLARRRRITGLVYSSACERVLVPLLIELAGDPGNAVTVVLPYPSQVSATLRQRLRDAGCAVDRRDGSLLQACRDGPRATVLLCLDHRQFYRYHRLGVEVAESLARYGVQTFCMQHGGTQDDSVAGLASSASSTLLVWGEATARRLQSAHGVPPARIRLVGNPLHDRLAGLQRDAARRDLAARHPAFWQRAEGKPLVLLATTIQREYAGYPDEQARYRRYLQHLYASLDFSRVSLVVKAHPNDLRVNDNLYEQLLPAGLPPGAALVLPSATPPDVYVLLAACDLLVTRASTVAEEALLLGRKVVAFDLDADGPARHYAHLGQWGPYHHVTATPEGALRDTIASVLAAPEVPASAARVRDVTFALDGGSLRRAALAVTGAARA
jgi:hypothetical protein